MPAKAILPADEVLLELHGQGMTMPAIAELYGTTTQAVSKRIRRAKGSAKQKLDPWIVRREHQRGTLFLWVKTYVDQVKARRKLNERDLENLRAMHAAIAAENEAMAGDIVIDYDPTLRSGWFLRARKPGDESKGPLARIERPDDQTDDLERLVASGERVVEPDEDPPPGRVVKMTRRRTKSG